MIVFWSVFDVLKAKLWRFLCRNKLINQLTFVILAINACDHHQYQQTDEHYTPRMWHNESSYSVVVDQIKFLP